MVFMSDTKKDIAIKPISGYDKDVDTKIEKQGFIAGLIAYGNKIIRYKSTSSTEILYTVPTGKVFYLITANASTFTFNAGGEAYLEDSSANRLIYVRNNSDGHTFAVSIPFSIPVKFTEGEVLKITGTAGVDAMNIYASIIGYEIDASLIPKFS